MKAEKQPPDKPRVSYPEPGKTYKIDETCDPRILVAVHVPGITSVPRGKHVVMDLLGPTRRRS